MRGFLRRVDFVTKPRSSILNFSSFVNVVRSNSIYQIPITPSSSIRQFHATELLLAKPKKDKKPKIIDDDDDLDDDDSPGTSKPSIDKNTLPEIPKFETQMDARIDKFISELEKLRSGNPSSDILSHITVNMTGSKIKITDLGQVSMRNQSQLSVSVFDPANVESVATAIREDKSLNLNPSVEGNLLLVTVPKPSREHRETLAKAAAKLADKVVSIFFIILCNY